MGERSQRFFRISVDLTEAQSESLSKILDQLSTKQKRKVTKRTLLHNLLRQQANELGIDWPADYPSHGGSRT